MASNQPKIGIRPPSWIDVGVPFHEITEWVQRAESLGFDSVHAGDRMLAKVPPYYESTMYEVITSLTTWAAHTNSIKLGPLIFVVPYRHPIQIAKIFGSLDIASDGRVVMGVGNGWNTTEFKALGIPKTERGRRLEEGVEIIKQIWSEDHVDYQGDIYNFEDVTIAPKPVQEPHPPIWFGSFGPEINEFTTLVQRVLKRIGRLGDGWVPLTYSTDSKEMLDPMKLGKAWEIIATAATEAGRDPNDIEIIYSHWSYVMEDEDSEQTQCMEAMGQWFGGDFKEGKETYLVGTPEKIAEDIEKATAEVPRVDRYIFTPFSFDEEQQDRLVNDVIPILQ